MKTKQILLASLYVLTFSKCSSTSNHIGGEESKVCETRSVMATSWTICLEDSKLSELQLKASVYEGFREIERIDEWMSEWKTGSLVSKINEAAGLKPVLVTNEAMEVIRESIEHSKKTDGAFDISFNVFFGRYSWKPGQERFPSDEDISRLLPLVNYKWIILDQQNSTVFLKKKGMKIGFGGNGQGWAADRVSDLLRSKSIQSGYVDGSGDTFFWGTRPSGKLWTVGIGNPRPPAGMKREDSTSFKLYLTNMAVTTAGDTEKFFIKDGKRFHHIIDPKTGRSADKSAQVTVFCRRAFLCDLADDGIFIRGPKRGLKYAKAIGVEAVLIEPSGRINLSSGLNPVDTKWGRSLEFNPSSPLALAPGSKSDPKNQ